MANLEEFEEKHGLDGATSQVSDGEKVHTVPGKQLRDRSPEPKLNFRELHAQETKKLEKKAAQLKKREEEKQAKAKAKADAKKEKLKARAAAKLETKRIRAEVRAQKKAEAAEAKKVIPDVEPTGQEVAILDILPVMTATSWELPEEFSQAQFEVWAKQLTRAEAGVQWWWGDLWLAAKDQGWWGFGEGQAYAEKLGIDYKLIKNYASVCKAFPKESRYAGLTYSHHRLATTFKTSKERHRALEKAVKHNLSARQILHSASKEKAIAKTKETAFKAEQLGKYAIIYADPPWRYDNPPIGGGRAIENKYPTMTLDEILKLPVHEIAADDAVLYLWVTNPHLLSGLSVLQEWGFEYKTNFVWAKNKSGLGYWLRNQHELCLFGVRGKPGIPEGCGRVSSLIEAPVGEHSAKPVEMLDIIDQCWPATRKIELFARTEAGKPLRKDWSAWGNQS